VNLANIFPFEFYKYRHNAWYAKLGREPADLVGLDIYRNESYCFNMPKVEPRIAQMLLMMLKLNPDERPAAESLLSLDIFADV